MQIEFGGARSCDQNFTGQSKKLTNLKRYISVITDIDQNDL